MLLLRDVEGVNLPWMQPCHPELNASRFFLEGFRILLLPLRRRSWCCYYQHHPRHHHYHLGQQPTIVSILIDPRSSSSSNSSSGRGTCRLAVTSCQPRSRSGTNDGIRRTIRHYAFQDDNRGFRNLDALMTRLTFRTIGTVTIACVDSAKEVSFWFCFVGNSIYIYILYLK